MSVHMTISEAHPHHALGVKEGRIRVNECCPLCRRAVATQPGLLEWAKAAARYLEAHRTSVVETHTKGRLHDESTLDVSGALWVKDIDEVLVPLKHRIAEAEGHV